MASLLRGGVLSYVLGPDDTAVSKEINDALKPNESCVGIFCFNNKVIKTWQFKDIDNLTDDVYKSGTGILQLVHTNGGIQGYFSDGYRIYQKIGLITYENGAIFDDLIDWDAYWWRYPIQS